MSECTEFSMKGLSLKLGAKGPELEPSASGATQLVPSGAPTPPTDSSAETPVLGLIQLWPDPALETHIVTEVDVVAIHGLGGHPYKTWREGGKLWLRDFLPQDIQTARVLTFGYNAGVAFTQTNSNIRDFATLLLEDLRTFRRRNKEKGRKFIFVCHSLGGIVLKQALIIAHEKQTRYAAIEHSIAGIIFLGTPHQGAELAFWSRFLAKIANAFTAGRMRDDLLKVLAPKSAELRTICAQFVERGMGLQIFSLYERHDFPGLGSLIVDEFSAILHLPNETPIPMEADHRGICKYLTNSDPCYRTICNCIEELMDSLADASGASYLNSSQREFVSRLRAINHDTILNQVPSGWARSSRWLFEHPMFKSWTGFQGQQTIWLHGLPGSGKTVLMKSIMTFLSDRSEDSSSPVIWKPISFFFDDKDPQRKTSDSFIRSVLGQILSDPRSAAVIKYLDKYVYVDRKNISKSEQVFWDSKNFAINEDGLWDCLNTIIARSRGIMFQLVVDAMDEALRHNSTPPTIIDRLHHLVDSNLNCRVKLLLSHRQEPPWGFQQSIKPAVIDVDNPQTRENIHQFVRMKVRNSLHNSKRSLAVATTIEERIIEKSQGNFLNAILAWEQFSRGVTHWTRAQIETSLRGLNRASDTLVDFYCQLLSNITARYRHKAKMAFTILRCCKERLSSTQLATLAVLSDLKLVNRDQDAQELKAQAADFEEYLVEACEYIIKIENHTVEFVHVSVKDMFSTNLETFAPETRLILSQFAVPASEGHEIMLRLCLKVMHLERRNHESWSKVFGTMIKAARRLSKTFRGLVPNCDEVAQLNALTVSHVDKMSRTACLKYAVRNWFNHYTDTSPNDTNDKKAISFLSSLNGCYCYQLWYELPTPDGESKMACLPRYSSVHLGVESSLETSLFRVIALGDFPGLVNAILRRASIANCVSNGITPLSWAILCQRPNIFQALLGYKDIQVNCGIYPRPIPIHYAAKCTQNSFFIKKLLECPDIDVNAVCETGTALHVALTSHNGTAADLILRHPQVNIFCTGGMEDSPYSLAFKHQMWEPLLLRMFDMAAIPETLSVRQVSGSSQFLWAGVHGWTEMEERVLREDHEQIFMVDQESGLNALMHYAFFGRKEKLIWILDRLPTHGLPLRSASDKYDLLHLCASQGWDDMVHLLQRKYKLESLKSDHQGRNLLHWAIENGWDLDQFDLSSYSVSDLDSQDRDRLAPIHIATSNRNMDALELLVVSGANLFLRDKNDMSAAHLAAHAGWRGGVEYFINTPHREFGRTRDGATLLHLVATWFEGPLVQKLMASGQTLVNATDYHRRTPLHYASINDNTSAMEALLDAGGKIDARDENGMTPLHEAIRCLAVKTARLLLERGANYKALDGFKQSCLHLSVRYDHRYLVKKFLQLGLEANTYDAFGMSPLHRACSTGNPKHVQLLLEQGASFTTTNCYQRSPLDIAAERENADAIRVLISWVDFLNMKTLKRRLILDRALLRAYQSECEEAGDILRMAGADVDRRYVRVRSIYMKGPTPESRWPLVPELTLGPSCASA